MTASQADAIRSETDLLRALTQEQMAQITELTRRLGLAEAQQNEGADSQIMRAGIEAMERRLQDSAFLSDAPGLNAGDFFARISMLSPVAGFIPFRAARLLTVNEPNP